MTAQTPLTDRQALLRFRRRAMARKQPAMFLHDRANLNVQERLEMVNRPFNSPAIVTGFPEFWESAHPGARMVDDSDLLDLTEHAHDLIIHAMSLHWANDPVGQLIQCRRALKPDGLFLAVFPGGQTLTELRQCFAQAESAITGGISPHVAPMADIRDLGSLLQRAGFALPVADSDLLTATYDSPTDLMHDLRAMGESNAMAAREKRPIQRAILNQLNETYMANFTIDGRVFATFELITLTGWAAAENQQQPLKRGSATHRLSDVLQKKR